VRSGGETTSRTVMHEVAVGERAVTRADEARMIEDGPLPARSAKGWEKNNAKVLDPTTYEKVYKHEPGYPVLTQKVKDNHYTDIEAFSGKIINRELKPGEQIYRLFGRGETTHGFFVKETYPGGNWWGLGPPPKTAKEWREHAAVLDEWNRDGFIVVATIPKDKQIKAAVGTIAEQTGKEIPGQFLPGGGMQAVIEMSKDAKTNLSRIAEEVMQTHKPASWIDSATGMVYEIRPTGWKDANGIHGYIRMPGAVTVQTARLGAREEATKENREVIVK